MPNARTNPSLDDRLLAELVRLREEAAGHPESSPAADALAVQAGGDLGQRVYARARALPGSDALLSAIGRVRLTGLTLLGLLLVLAAAAGVAAASSALGATRPVSLPLVLLIVVGMNVAMLLLWSLTLPWSQRIAPGLGSGVRWLWARSVDDKAQSGSPAPAVLQLIAAGGVGRWLMAALVHAAWLVFALASLLALTVLLSVRGYPLSWETTLLTTDSLAAWARVLSAGPALLGANGMDTLSVVDTSSAIARQAWSHWLLTTAFVYGVLPRAIALSVCLVLLLRAQARVGRDMTRPGFARLRSRLLPDHDVLGVTDAAPAMSPAHAPIATPTLQALPAGRMHGLWLDGVASDRPPALAGVEWLWLGTVDGAESRDRVQQSLPTEKIVALAILVRATLTPDRGSERFIGELVALLHVPIYLLLADFEKLQARGEENCRNRLSDWQALAKRAGASAVITLPMQEGSS